MSAPRRSTPDASRSHAAWVACRAAMAARGAGADEAGAAAAYAAAYARVLREGERVAA